MNKNLWGFLGLSVAVLAFMSMPLWGNEEASSAAEEDEKKKKAPGCGCGR